MGRLKWFQLFSSGIVSLSGRSTGFANGKSKRVLGLNWVAVTFPDQADVVHEEKPRATTIARVALFVGVKGVWDECGVGGRGGCGGGCGWGGRGGRSGWDGRDKVFDHLLKI
mgnify:FL=1